MQPRNSTVILKLFQKSEEKTDKGVVVLTGKDLTCEALIIDVGPGQVAAEGGIPDTFDLKPGQRVLINHKLEKQTSMGVVPTLVGMEYKENGETYHLFNQDRIIGILSQPNQEPLN